MPDPTLTDLYTWGLPLAAMGTVNTTVQQQHLNAAIQKRNAAFRARYGASFDVQDLAADQAVCQIAAASILTIRGYDPNKGSDQAIFVTSQTAEKWLADVQRQAAHPNVVVTPTSVDLDAPSVISNQPSQWQRKCNGE
jgi:hypothetical protein